MKALLACRAAFVHACKQKAKVLTGRTAPTKRECGLLLQMKLVRYNGAGEAGRHQRGAGRQPGIQLPLGRVEDYDTVQRYGVKGCEGADPGHTHGKLRGTDTETDKTKN